MGNDPTILGCVGTIVVPTRGADGPGEVLVKVRGGTEAYLAWSEHPLPKGTQVVVFEFRGERTVDVMEFGDSLDA
jgi:membrane protein implicated in regulation of membrane protease activity